MLKLFFLFLIISLISCDGNNNATLANPSATTSSLNPEGNGYLGCSVEVQAEGVVRILCADGSEAIVKNGQDGADGQSCEVSEQVGGVLLKCGDSTAFIKHGIDGQDGSACSVKEDTVNGGALIECSDGSMAFIRDGLDGKSCEVQETPQGIVMVCGDDTVVVQHGEQGESCFVYEEAAGATIKCGDGVAFIANGEAGENCQVIPNAQGAEVVCGGSSVVIQHGTDGSDGVVEVVDPCGPSGGYDEVLLVLDSGEIIAYFENGGQRHLVSLPFNKTYQTTDGTGCRFKITSGGEIIDL